MKKITLIGLLALSSSLIPACSAESGDEVAQDPATGQVSQGICPSSLSCPYDPAFPTFLYAINVQTLPDGSPGPINCIRRNAQWQTKQYPLTKPAGCTTCCAYPWCPDPRYNQLTYSGAWNCSAP